MISVQRLTQLLVDVADTRGDDFDLVPFLTDVCGHVVEVTGGAAVGLVLLDPEGALLPMATALRPGTPPSGTDVLLALHTGPGPHRESTTSGEVVAADDLAATSRWPVFAPAAVRAGYTRVHVVPMRLRDETIGAMALLGGDGPPYSISELDTVRALADLTTIAVLRERHLSQAEAAAEQLRLALETRVGVEQAKGVIAQREGVSPTEAFVLLRSAARSSNRRLVDVAHDVVHGAQRS